MFELAHDEVVNQGDKTPELAKNVSMGSDNLPSCLTREE
jgi:hypothetical protein